MPFSLIYKHSVRMAIKFGLLKMLSNCGIVQKFPQEKGVKLNFFFLLPAQFSVQLLQIRFKTFFQLSTIMIKFRNFKFFA